MGSFLNTQTKGIRGRFQVPESFLPVSTYFLRRADSGRNQTWQRPNPQMKTPRGQLALTAGRERRVGSFLNTQTKGSGKVPGSGKFFYLFPLSSGEPIRGATRPGRCPNPQMKTPRGQLALTAGEKGGWEAF